MIRKLSVVTLILGVANIAVHSVVSQPVRVAENGRQAAGCGTLGSSIPSRAVLASLAQESLRSSSPASPVGYDCRNCVIYSVSNIHWCATVCYDPWPWHENYEKEKPVWVFSCPARRVHCGEWVDSGCCGSSDKSEPACEPNSEHCDPNALPPTMSGS